VATDEMTAVELPQAGARWRGNVRRTQILLSELARERENHRQAFRFLCVGASGYIVNLATLAVCVHALNFDFTVSFVIAFLAGCANNFWWNRHWTFDARDEHPAPQSMRFLLVSILVSVFAYAIAKLLIGTGMEEVLAQALAYIAATPLSFLAQKLWSFRA
jgi:putative flippase GtrA